MNSLDPCYWSVIQVPSTFLLSEHRFRNHKLFYSNFQTLLFNLLLDIFLMPINSIKHAAVTGDLSLSWMDTLSLSPTTFRRDSLMLTVFLPTRTCPIRYKLLAYTALAVLLRNIMILIRMFTAALEILRPIDWEVDIIATLTSSSFTLYLSRGGFTKVVVVFVEVVAEAFGGESDVFAFFAVLVYPCRVQSVFAQGLMLFLILFELFL